MNDNTQNTSSAESENTQQEAENAAAEVQETTEEKKYTDSEMNNISKKNSEKAVAKLLKELGITDRQKAKEILRQASERENGTADTETEGQLRSQLEEATKQARQATLENIFLQNNVQARKIARASRLVDEKDCLDENGRFSRQKAENAVKELLKEWPELLQSTDSAQVGFKIGADTSEKKTTSPVQKQPVQKSWNKFNQ